MAKRAALNTHSAQQQQNEQLIIQLERAGSIWTQRRKAAFVSAAALNQQMNTTAAIVSDGRES